MVHWEAQSSSICSQFKNLFLSHNSYLKPKLYFPSLNPTKWQVKGEVPTEDQGCDIDILAVQASHTLQAFKAHWLVHVSLVAMPKTLYFTYRMDFCVLSGSQNKQ
jgi:hypothetical protein